MAGYTKQIFDLLGVEPGKEFRLWYYNSDMNKRTFAETFMLTANLDLCYFDTKIKCDGYPHLHGILNNTFKIIKIFHPTTEEQLAIDYARACGMKWLAKDKNKTVAAFKEKPKKGAGQWLNTSNDFDDWIELYLPISFLSWEDEEPFYIGD